MTLNLYKLRKYAAFVLAGTIPALLLALLSVSYGLIWGGIIGFLIGLILIIPIGSLMIKHPFTAMIEGKGILALNLDSTGVIQPFIMNVNQPKMTGKIGGKLVSDTFDREAVAHLAAPKKAGRAVETDEQGGIRIRLDEAELNRGRFALFHYPVVIYNRQLGTVLTKDWFSEKEKTAFAEHGILHMNHQVQELTGHVRDFGRYVVESLKPKSSLLSNWWVWVIVVVFIIILLALFAPGIMDAIGGFGSGAGSALQTAGSQGPAGGPVSPR